MGGYLLKKISFLFLLLFVFCFEIRHIKANEEDLEKIYLNGGYQETNKAIKEASAFFGENILLPTRLPDVSYTHSFARFTTREMPKLEISFLNKNSGQTHYKIFVTSLKYKQKFNDQQNASRFKLEDKSEAIYLVKENFSLLIFEKNKFQYSLVMDRQNSNIVTNKELIRIANSVR